MVVLVCTYFRLCSLTRGCMNMLALQRIAYKVIGNVLHFSSSQMVRCPALDDTSALVVIESGVIISGHSGSVHACCYRSCQQSFAAFRVAGAVARRGCGVVQRGGYSVLADERVVIVVVHRIHYRSLQRDILGDITMKGSACIITPCFYINLRQL